MQGESGAVVQEEPGLQIQIRGAQQHVSMRGDDGDYHDDMHMKRELAMTDQGEAGSQVRSLSMGGARDQQRCGGGYWGRAGSADAGADPTNIAIDDMEVQPPLVVDLTTLGQSEFDLAGTFARQDRPALQFVPNLENLGQSKVAIKYMPGDEDEQDRGANEDAAQDGRANDLVVFQVAGVELELRTQARLN